MDIDIEKTLASLSEKGLSQVEIAAELECTQAAVSAMSRGLIGKKRPSYKVVDGLRRLAQRYNIDLSAPKEMAGSG